VSREEIDLHGKSLEEARDALEKAVRSCFVRGVAEVLVIHGHGREREKPGLLRDMVREWALECKAQRPSFIAAVEDGERTREFRGNVGVTMIRIAITERGNVYRVMRPFHVDKRSFREGELVHVADLKLPADAERYGFVARLVPRS
jgi:hypothetical protein